MFDKGNLPAFQVRGSDGVDLAQWWDENRFQAYEGVSVPGFPNLFLILGPYGYNGASYFTLIENQARHIVRCLRRARSTDSTSVEITREANQRYFETMLGRRDRQVFFQGSCATANSYYFDSHGDAPFRSATTLEAAWRSAHFVAVDVDRTAEGVRPGIEAPQADTVGARLRLQIGQGDTVGAGVRLVSRLSPSAPVSVLSTSHLVASLISGVVSNAPVKTPYLTTSRSLVAATSSLVPGRRATSGPKTKVPPVAYWTPSPPGAAAFACEPLAATKMPTSSSQAPKPSVLSPLPISRRRREAAPVVGRDPTVGPVLYAARAVPAAGDDHDFVRGGREDPGSAGSLGIG